MRRTPSPNRVNPADGTGVSSVYKPLPPKNSRDGIDLAKRKIRAYSKEREVITTPATTKNKIPDIRSRFPEQGCNGIVSVNKRNFIRRSAPNNTPVSHTAPRPLHAPYVKQGLSTSFTPMGEEPLNDVARSSIQKGRERSVSRQPSVDTPQRKRSRSGSRVSPMTGRPPSKSRQPSIERPPIKGDRETTHSSKTDKTRKKSVDPVVMNHQASRSTPKQRGNSEARAPSSNRQVHMSSNRAGSSAAKPAVARNRSPSVAPRGSFLSDGHRSLADTVRIKTVTAATPSSFNRRSRSVNNSVEDITSRSLKCSYKYGDYRRRVNDDKFGESLDDQRELAAMLKNHWKQIQERFLILEKIIRFMDSKIHEAKIIKSIEDEKRAKRRSEKENEQRRVREEKRREKQRRQEEHEKADREETQRNMEEEVRRQLKRPSRLSEAEKQRETGRKRRYGAAGANNMQQYAAATDMELSESKSHRSGTFNQQQQQHSSGIGSYHDPHDSGNQQQLYPNNLNQQLKRDPVLRAQTSATYRTWMVKRES